MLDLLAAWLLYPVVALLICLGLGLLLERLFAHPLPGVLLLPVGMAVLFAVPQPFIMSGATAEAALVVPVLLAVAGLWLGRGTLRARRPDPWALLAAGIPAAVVAAPVLLSGAVTFAGYTVLGDTSIHMLGADEILTRGLDFDGMPPSSYEFSLFAYFGQNYPTGGAVVAGILTTLVGQDVAWTFHVLNVLLIALAALALYSLLTPHVASRRWRAAIVAIAAQPAISVAYVLQESVKEVGALFFVALLAALVPPTVAATRTWRAAIPLAVAGAGFVAVVGAVAALWVAPISLVALVARGRPSIKEMATYAVVLILLALPAFLALRIYVEVTGGVVTAQKEVGNLLQPLKSAQLVGIWITGEYRLPPKEDLGITYAFIGMALAGVVLGVGWAARRLGVALYVVVCLAAFAFVTWRGSPWADGKALAIHAPAVLLLAGLGFATLRRTAGAVLFGIVALGVLWSNALAYHDVSVAPRDRFEELDRIGQSGLKGPTLYTEFEEWGKHFLRDGAPEGTSEGWQRRFAIAIEGSSIPLFGVTTDTDRLTQRYMTYYRTIVLRRGSYGSRPPSNYERRFKGKFYDVWERRDDRELRARMPLGLGRQPVAEPDCAELKRFAAGADTLAYVERPPNAAYRPADGEHSPNWFVDPADAPVLRTVGRGRAAGPMDEVPAGRYDLWVEGSFGRTLTIRFDGREVARVGDHLNARQVDLYAATLDLPAGAPQVEVTDEGGSLAPGNGGNNRLLGHVTLTPPDPTGLPVREIPASDYRTLCGRSLDWVESVS